MRQSPRRDGLTAKLNSDTGTHIMATAPTTAEIQEYIFDYIRQSGRNPRVGDIAADLVQPQLYVNQNYGVRAAEYEVALNDLIDNDYFDYEGGKFIKLTKKGFARL